MLLSHLMRPSSWTILTKFAVHIILFDKLFLFFIYGKDKLESEENALFNKPKPFRDTYNVYVCMLGLTQWNLNSFEFKFDDTRLSNVRMQQTKYSIWPILFLYNEEIIKFEFKTT